ncbi:divisome protein SepX/GlpR [Streptomyces pactum]|uniref:divisome protein SepX/GlpR n=1 Tax=Streptomyces pactum TaxID=68249 RepID=UPI0036F4EEED
MSSSGLIYAVIVGAWAAYLVPMWLRRQDELNEARPTERFSTAIRLLSGRAGMERRYAKDLQARAAEDPAGPDDGTAPADHRGVHDPDALTDVVDVRAFVEPPDPDDVPGSTVIDPAGPAARDTGRPVPPAVPSPLERSRRAKVLARRRRTTVVLFLAFTVGAVVAAVGGVAFLWAPGIPAVLLSAYIVHLRAQERRRFAFTMDQRRAELAAQQLRERALRSRSAAGGPGGTPAGPAPARAEQADPGAREHATGGRRTDHATGGRRTDHATGGRRTGYADGGEGRAAGADRPAPRPDRAAAAERPGQAGPARADHRAPAHRTPAPADRRAADRHPAPEHPGPAPRDRQPDRAAQGAAAAAEAAAAAHAADRRALVEQTDHAEWVDQQRDRGPAAGGSWDPVPVPLPTYVTAPVAPRAQGNVDLDAADAWSSARSGTAGPAEQSTGSREVSPRPRPAAPPRRPRERGRTPLFDQYADEDRPRAANE